MKPFPSGIITLLAGDMVGHRVNLDDGYDFDNPRVSAFRYRGALDVINPRPGIYDWSKLDDLRARCAARGLNLGISIALGTTTPAHFYTNGVTKYTLADGSGSMPVPWQPEYQAKLFAFIDAFAARFDGDPLVSYIVITGFMQTNGMFLASDADRALMPLFGYPNIDSAYIDGAAKPIVNKWLTAFGNTVCIVTTQPVFDGVIGRQDESAVTDYGAATYPAHFGTMFNGRRAILPQPQQDTRLNPNPKGSQMFASAMLTNGQSNPAVYVPPVPSPLPIYPIPLNDCLETAKRLQDDFVECYKFDLNDGRSQSILASQSAALLQNLPPGQRIYWHDFAQIFPGTLAFAQGQLACSNLSLVLEYNPDTTCQSAYIATRSIATRSIATRSIATRSIATRSIATRGLGIPAELPKSGPSTRIFWHEFASDYSKLLAAIQNGLNDSGFQLALQYDANNVCLDAFIQTA